MTTRNRPLGRGLDALIGSSARRRETLAPQTQNIEKANDASDSQKTELKSEAPVSSPRLEQGERLEYLPLRQLTRGKYQPRRDIQPEALEELADSIRAQGVMQPIVVRQIGAEHYEIIAGERRWRASQLAEKETIPAVIREVSDEVALALALIENIQRENLNPVEEALALKRLLDEFELTQQQVADAVGRSRTQVTNLLRLLALDPQVLTLLERGDLDMGHARALLSLSPTKQRHAAHEVVARDLTVRQTEALVKQIQSGHSADAKKRQPQDVGLRESKLSDLLGAPVKIHHNQSGTGRVTIRYASLNELDEILGHMN